MKIDRSRTMADAEYEKQIDASAGTPIRKGDYLPGNYRVETDAIRGGMGSVWRIYQTEYGVNMALKRPRQKYFTSPEQKLDFIRECDTWLNLGIHPNIVTCFRVAAIYGVPSIFSEWMDFSLKNAIADGTLYEGASKEQEKRLLDLAIQSAEGLCYAHAFRNEKDEPAGIIHQDVKPDNLLLTQDWQLKVADFGLSGAYAVLAAEGVPSPASASGDTTILSPAGGYTIAYCSAEQMDHRPLSRRTDIYSWAVSMMEMYIGSRPWETGVVAGLRCGEYMKHTRVRMAPRLKELLARCMERDADKRPHDFEELIDALRDIYHEEFSENYFRARPEIIRGKSDSSRAAHKADEVIPSLSLGGMDEIKAVLEKKPDAFDVLVPLAGLPGNFSGLGYCGEFVYCREAMRLRDIVEFIRHDEGRGTFDYTVADYPVLSTRELERLVETLLAHLREEKRVAIFCADGYKQTPYIAACVLFQMGIEEPHDFLRERYGASFPDGLSDQQHEVDYFRFRHIAETYWGCTSLMKKVRLKDGCLAGKVCNDDPDIRTAYEQISKELGERARILVRPSGVLPELSMLVEAPDEEQCERAVETYIDALKRKGYFQEVVR